MRARLPSDIQTYPSAIQPEHRCGDADRFGIALGFDRRLEDYLESASHLIDRFDGRRHPHP